MSKPLKDEQARRLIVSDLIATCWSRLAPGPARPTDGHADGRRHRGGRVRIEQMAAVTFTRKAAAELRGRFQLALEDELGAREARRPTEPAGERIAPRARRISSASSPARSTRSARICFASGRSRPAWRPGSPSWTKSRSQLRRQAWRDISRRREPPATSLLELLDAGMKPRRSGQAFETDLHLEDVSSRPATRSGRTSKAAGRQLEAFWATCSKLLPDADRPERDVQDAGARAVGSARAAARSPTRSDRPSTLVELLDDLGLPAEGHPERWTDDQRSKKRIGTMAEALHATFRDERRHAVHRRPGASTSIGCRSRC